MYFYVNDFIIILGLGMQLSVEHPFSIHKALGLIPSFMHTRTHTQQKNLRNFYVVD
jgi:hypothetical protein